MKSPDRVRPRRVALALLVGALLAPLAAVVAALSPASAAETMCLPVADQSACLASTVRTEEAVVPNVTINVTGPGGFDESVTTSQTGAWNVQVTEPGEYTVTIDEKTLPDDVAVAGSPSRTVSVRLGSTTAPVIGVRTAAYDATTSFGEELVKSSFNGLKLGLLLAMASIGLSLIYGTTGLSNFAHAEQVTMGGMLGFLLINPNQAGLGLFVGGILVVLLCATTGFVQDAAIWRPLRRRGLGLAQQMIVTIGLSLALQYTFQFFVGAGTVKVALQTSTVHQIGPITFTTMDLFAMGLSAAVLILVGLALQRTRVGRATRAISDNPSLASASGIDVDRVIRLVWTLAAGLAGLAGLLYALVIQRGMRWDSGLQILLILFAAVTLGGLGTAFGALVGSLIVGLVIELAPLLGAPGDLKYAVALLMLIVLLLVRPQGLLGRAERVG